MNKITEALLIEKVAKGTPVDISEYRKAREARSPEEESKSMTGASKIKTTARVIGLSLGAGLALATMPTGGLKKLILPSLFGGFIGGRVGERIGAKKYNKDLGFSVTRRRLHPTKPKVEKI